MRFCIPEILNKTSNMITDKIQTHSRKGFTAYIKLFLINKYDPICSTPNCHICSLDYWILIYLISLFHLSCLSCLFFNFFYFLFIIIIFFFFKAWTSSFMVFDVPVGVWLASTVSASRPWWDIARLANRLPNNDCAVRTVSALVNVYVYMCVHCKYMCICIYMYIYIQFK